MDSETPIITSLQNPRVRRTLALRNRRDRDREKLALIEGARAITRAEAAGIDIIDVFFCKKFANPETDNQIKRLGNLGANILLCNDAVFEKLAYCENPDGIIAVARQKECSLERIVLSSNPLVLVAETLEKPGNLGAILRTADAAGVEAVLICDCNTDIYNPNVIRSSMGLVFSMPLAQTDSRTAMTWLGKRGIRALAASPHAKMDYTKTDCRGPLAVVVGAENEGLSADWMHGADMTARIPMLGKGDSLNVSVAAGILLFEAVRQRRK